MRKLLIPYILGLLGIVMIANSLISYHMKTTDAYIRNRVVQLEGNNYGCTGIEVKAPSGRTYILTAGHCMALVDKETGEVDAITEKGNHYTVNVIIGDIEHDLLLLTSANSLSIDVADKVYEHQKVHTLTHGNRFPTYRTDGEMLEEREVHIHGEYILSKEDMDKCNTSYASPAFDGRGLYCAIKMTMHIASAYVIPGSSGGPLLDSSGRLVGIVSCTYNDFGGFVPLHDIKQFLKGH